MTTNPAELLAATNELAKANLRAAGAEHNFRTERATTQALAIRLKEKTYDLADARDEIAHRNHLLDTVADLARPKPWWRREAAVLAEIRKVVGK